MGSETGWEKGQIHLQVILDGYEILFAYEKSDMRCKDRILISGDQFTTGKIRFQANICFRVIGKNTLLHKLQKTFPLDWGAQMSN